MVPDTIFKYILNPQSCFIYPNRLLSPPYPSFSPSKGDTIPKFERNDKYAKHRGFATLTAIPRTDGTAEIVWQSPDGNSTLTPDEAKRNNDARRAQLTIADSWRDLKESAPEVAEGLGWNEYQKLTRKSHQSFDRDGKKIPIRKEILNRLNQEFDLSQEEIQQLFDSSFSVDDETGRKIGGWGDSGAKGA